MPTDLLPSWNDGPAKKAIVDFVRGIAATYFPGLAPSEAEDPGMPKSDNKRGKD